MENSNLEAKQIEEATTKQESFKTFDNEEEYQKFINEKVNTNEQNLRAKIEPEIKARLEKEAKLSAEEKLNERIKELETEKRAVLADKNRTKAEREFISKGLNLGNYGEILDFIVSEDEKVTLDKTSKLIGFIETNSKNIADEKIKRIMQDVVKPENTEAKEQNPNENIAQKLGKSTSDMQKTALETLKKYL